MANRRQQTLDAIQTSMEGIEPSERSTSPALDDWGDELDIQMLEYALFPKARLTYVVIKQQGITPEQWLEQEKKTVENRTIYGILQDLANDEREDENFRQEVEDAWTYITTHNLMPCDWLDRFEKRSVYAALCERWEMKMDFEEHLDEWSGPTLPMSAIQNL